MPGFNLGGWRLQWQFLSPLTNRYFPMAEPGCLTASTDQKIPFAQTQSRYLTHLRLVQLVLTVAPR